MHDEQSGQSQALAQLRRRLNEGMLKARLNQTEVASLAGLGRTTVSEALSPAKPAPSPRTVQEMARVLRLPVNELLELRRTAEDTSSMTVGDEVRLGRPIGRWDPHELEVHPAGFRESSSNPNAPAARVLPGYVRREHDRVLDEAVHDAMGGHSRMVVLVGTSSTGKTRACWEAVQPLEEKGWRLWHPFDPTRAEAALADLCRVGPRTVVWLNEAQHYLGDRAVGERIAAAVHQILIDEQRGPALVLGTLWPEYAAEYTSLPTPGREDPYSRVRELLAGRTFAVPDAFDSTALATAAALADQGDRLLADALTRARDGGRVAQDLSGAPELLRRYEQATPAARALLEAAMDARRLGVGLQLPHAFLTDAAPDYLDQNDYDQLTDDWAERAYAQLAAPVHGKQAPLRRTAPRPPRRPPIPPNDGEPTTPPLGPAFRLADYLEQHGRTTRRHLCPPDSFWHAAHTHLTHPNDLGSLTQAAESRHRLQWAHHLRHRAADHGNSNALTYLAERKEEAGNREAAESLARRAAARGSTYGLTRLSWMREEAGDYDAAENLLRQAIKYGSISALAYLAARREEAGDREEAEALARQAADRGDTFALSHLATIRGRAGNWEAAESLARQAAAQGDVYGLTRLAGMREETGNLDAAEILLGFAADHGSTHALVRLAEIRGRAGNWAAAEDLFLQAADGGDPFALYDLAVKREEAGDREAAEDLARQAADCGHILALCRLAVKREEAGDREAAENLLLQAADGGDPHARYRLVEMRERVGDREGAERLLLQAADRGDVYALAHLAEMREKDGDREGQESLLLQAANQGDTTAEPVRLPYLSETLSKLWPYGLNADGMPTPPWQLSVPARHRGVPPPNS
ncbi:hypothetical protein [Streptomyces sp. NPDC002825]|uniref:hypothetical protein n=1 Tax=Streptomyces sp. NPDC002825 TaxID=3154666 RepID=UPI003318D942